MAYSPTKNLYCRGLLEAPEFSFCMGWALSRTNRMLFSWNYHPPFLIPHPYSLFSLSLWKKMKLFIQRAAPCQSRPVMKMVSVVQNSNLDQIKLWEWIVVEKMLVEAKQVLQSIESLWVTNLPGRLFPLPHRGKSLLCFLGGNISSVSLMWRTHEEHMWRTHDFRCIWDLTLKTGSWIEFLIWIWHSWIPWILSCAPWLMYLRTVFVV